MSEKMPWVASVRRALEVAITGVYGGHRTQIPSEICAELEIRDGDKVVWMVRGGEYFIRKVGGKPTMGPTYSIEPTKEELEGILRRKGVSEAEIKRLLEAYEPS